MSPLRPASLSEQCSTWSHEHLPEDSTRLHSATPVDSRWQRWRQRRMVCGRHVHSKPLHRLHFGKSIQVPPPPLLTVARFRVRPFLFALTFGHAQCRHEPVLRSSVCCFPTGLASWQKLVDDLHKIACDVRQRVVRPEWLGTGGTRCLIIGLQFEMGRFSQIGIRMVEHLVAARHSHAGCATLHETCS